MDQIKYPLSSTDKKILKDVINEILPDLVLDQNWNKYFYCFEWLGSITSAGDPGTWDLGNTSGSGTVSGPGGYFVLSTGATNSSIAEIVRLPQVQRILSFDKKSRFRIAFVSDTANNQTAYMVRGNVIFATTKYYGLKLVNNDLYGVSYNTAEATVLLISGVDHSSDYNVECRLTPKEKVEFFILNKTTGVYELKGLLNTQIPSQIGILSQDVGYAELYITNSAASDKRLLLMYFEYIQER